MEIPTRELLQNVTYPRKILMHFVAADHPADHVVIVHRLEPMSFIAKAAIAEVHEQAY